MGRARSRLVLALLAVLLTPTGAVGCTRVVAGTPAPDAVAVTPTATPGPIHAETGVPGADPTSAPMGSVATDTGTAPLRPDVLADECLLDAAQLSALLGRPVGAPAQSVVARDDGSRSSSCYVGPVEGAAGPMAALNVYGLRRGTPAQFVRATGGRALRGAGQAAVVLDTAAGPTLQVASARFLVTVVVQGSTPNDAAWRVAARAALARLPH